MEVDKSGLESRCSQKSRPCLQELRKSFHHWGMRLVRIAVSVRLPDEARVQNARTRHLVSFLQGQGAEYIVSMLMNGLKTRNLLY